MPVTTPEYYDLAPQSADANRVEVAVDELAAGPPRKVVQWVKLGAGDDSVLVPLFVAEDSAHVSGDFGLMALGVRKDAAAALAGTDGDYQPPISDDFGRLYTRAASDSISLTGTKDMTTAAGDIIAPVNVERYGWVSVQLTGTWTGTVRVEISDTGVAADFVGSPLQTANSTNAFPSISLTANGVYHGPLVAGWLRFEHTVVGTGTINVKIVLSSMPRGSTSAGIFVRGITAYDTAFVTATDPVVIGGYSSAAVPASTGADGRVGRAWLDRVGRQIVDLIDSAGSSVYGAVTDAASLTGGLLARLKQIGTLLGGGLPAALVGGRLDVNVGAALPAGTANIGDVDVLTLPSLPAGASTIGAVNQTVGQGKTLLFASVSVAGAGANQIVAADVSNKIKVVSYVLVADAAVTAKWQSATTDKSGAMSLAANGGVSAIGQPSAHLLETAVNESLNLNLGGAVGVRGHISYFKEP